MANTSKFDQALKQLLQFPQFVQGYGMLSAMGKGLDDYIVQGSEGKKNKKASPVDWLKLGPGQWLNIGKFMTDMPQIGKDFQAKEANDYQESLKTLAGTPGWSQVYKEMNGEFDPEFNAALDKSMGQAFSYGMGGGGVNSGMAHDPMLQAAIAGPLAFQVSQYKKQIQQMSQDKIMAAAGGFGISPIQSAYKPQTAMSYLPALQNSLQMWNQQGQFGQQMNLQKKGMYYDFYGDLAGAGLGALGGMI